MVSAMEKNRCEFCGALCPFVYCQSDAAHLCLSCDVRVHWANALSYRHTRTPVCESCGYRSADVRCLDHEMFMCQDCDTSSHHDDVPFQHRRNVVGCYVGCPSAKELAGLWGFDSDELGINNSFEFEGGFCSRGTKVKVKHIMHAAIASTNQSMEGFSTPWALSTIHVKEQIGRIPFKHDTMCKSHTGFNNHMDYFGSDLGSGSPLEEPLWSPFSQLDNNFTMSSAVINTPLQGDSFWQYKSPAHNNEIWFESMQDHGLCDEVGCFDAVNTPDVDLTFHNFEELFGNEHEISRVDVEYTQCSFSDKQSSFGNIDRGCARTLEDIRGPSPVCLNAADNESHSSDQSRHLRPIN